MGRRRAPRRWGPCRLCEAPAWFRCARCKHWRCTGHWLPPQDGQIPNELRPAMATDARFRTLSPENVAHFRLRKVPGKIGVYRLVCWPHCILRKTEPRPVPMGPDPDPLLGE